VDSYNTLRCRYEDGVLAYFLRRTRAADLAWELSVETWAAARIDLARRRAGDPPPPAAWVFAIARETLCGALHSGCVPDRARRKAGVGRVELTDAGARWVRQVATEESLAVLVADLQPALREAIMAPVPLRDAQGLAAQVRARPHVPDAEAAPARRRSARFSRVRLASR
jgi:DNA-directed RNA polymerase specialized sigma24 family protein